MNRSIVMSVAAFVAFSAAAASRTGVADGDAQLHGPLGEAFGRMLRNQVLATDPVYLTECYKVRRETSLWQTEFWGKYMHAAAPFWTMTRCPLLKEKLDAGVANLLPSQQDDGYLGNYCEEKRYAKGTWDVWGTKYTMMGLLHYYDAVGAKDGAAALKTCGRLCDYLISKVGPGTKPGLAGTGYFSGQPSCSVLEPVMWLYNRTGEKRYLDFADFVVREMTERKDGPRLLDLASVPVAERSPVPQEGPHFWEELIESRAKAYEMMSCYQGLLEYYEVTGRKDLLAATQSSVASIIRDEINLAGGAAAYEHWFHGRDYQHKPFGSLQETCVTITWMRLCEKLLALTGDPAYADEFEKTFCNAYLGALHPDGSYFASYTPLGGYRSKGQIHCRMHTNCCDANGPRGFLSFLRSILQAKDDEVFLNYYASSTVSVEVPSLKEKATFEIHTLYPKTGHVDIRFQLPKPMKFKFSVRIPGCTAGNAMTVNGAAVEAKYLEGPRYTMHERTWRPGDVVTLDFGLPVRAHVVDDAVAFTRGPVLLARDSRFGDGDLSAELRPWEFDFDAPKGFELETTENPDEMGMVVSALLPVGGHEEDPNGREPRRIRFCDYASAGNRFRADNWYRVFLPIQYDQERIAALQAKVQGEAERPKSRMDRTRLNVGTYCLAKNARTEAHVKAIRDCGIDFVIGELDRPTLDLFAKHGLGSMLAGVVPWWWGGAGGERNGHMAELNPLWQYDAAARKFRDHPAVWAIDIGDEPSALDFGHYGKVVENTVRNYPNQFPYLNLFPNYALPGKEGQDLSETQLGARSYREHIALYCRHVPLDYICYDHYPWGWSCTRANMFENLRIVADACTATRRSLWIVLQANTHIEGRIRNRQMTENTMRFQANAALAFGAETITWACWTKGWWEDNVLDTNGVQTATYAKLRTVNAELHRLSPAYMRYRRLFTDLVGFPAESAKQVRQPSVKASSGPAFADVRAADGAALAVGHFAARDGSGSYAIYVAACDDPEDAGGAEHEITFAVRPDRTVAAQGADGAVAVTKAADGTCRLRLRSNRGVLVTAEDPL